MTEPTAPEIPLHRHWELTDQNRFAIAFHLRFCDNRDRVDLENVERTIAYLRSEGRVDEADELDFKSYSMIDEKAELATLDDFGFGEPSSPDVIIAAIQEFLPDGSFDWDGLDDPRASWPVDDAVRHP